MPHPTISTGRCLLAGGALWEFYDGFVRANGTLGGAWNGASGTIAGNQALLTPTLDIEKLPQPGFEAWVNPTTPTGWTPAIAGTTTVNQEAVVMHGGSFSCRIDVDASNSTGSVSDGNNAAGWYLVNWWGYASAAGKGLHAYGSNAYALYGPYRTPGSVWTNYNDVFWCSTNSSMKLLRGLAASSSIYFDDASWKLLTIATCFAQPVMPAGLNGDGIVSCKLAAMESGTIAGLVMALNSAAAPTSYLLAYVTAGTAQPWNQVGTVRLDQLVAGTRTNLVNYVMAFPFAAGDEIKLVKRGSSIRLVYNNSVLAAAAAVDSSLVANTLCGLFSTHPTNTFSEFRAQMIYGGGSQEIVNPYFLGDMAIFPLGDSRTAGATATWATGYPVLLRNSLSQLDHRYWAESPTRHATGGWTIANLDADLAATLGAIVGTPTHILIDIGINDTATGEAAFKASMDSINTQLQAKWSTVPIYWALQWKRAFDPTAMNTWITARVAATPGTYIGPDETILLEGGDDGATYTTDGTHPNDAGFIRMAAGWKAVMGY